MIGDMKIRTAEPSDVEVLVTFNCAMANVGIHATSWVCSPCSVYHRASAKSLINILRYMQETEGINLNLETLRVCLRYY